MKTKDIKNEVVKQVIKTALQNKFAVTIANVKDSYVEKYGTAFRIKKGSMTGLDILIALAKYMKTTSNDLLSKNAENNTPGFFMLDNSLIVTDPETK